MAEYRLSVQLHGHADDIVEIVDGPGDAPQGQVHDGVQYDFVFNVDIGDGEPIRKLPYNRSDDPYAVADKWLLKENLPLMYRQQVVEFILQNSGQNNLVPDPSFRNPFTGANAYVPGGQPSSSNGNAPKQIFKHIPKSGMLSFETAQFDGILKKVTELNTTLSSESASQCGTTNGILYQDHMVHGSHGMLAQAGYNEMASAEDSSRKARISKDKAHRQGGGCKPESVRRSTRRGQANLFPLPPSPVSVCRVTWSKEYTELLYKYYVTEMETSGTRAPETLSDESFKIITQKLCDKGLLCNLTKVKEKVRTAKRMYKAWKDSQGGKNFEGWKDCDHRFEKPKDGPPQFFKLLQAMFEAKQSIVEDNQITLEGPAVVDEAALEDEASHVLDQSMAEDNEKTSEAPTVVDEAALEGLLVVEVRLLTDGIKGCLQAMGELKRAQSQSISLLESDKTLDDFDIERVEQLTSAYNSALAAARENPCNDELIRLLMEAKLNLAAAVLSD